MTHALSRQQARRIAVRAQLLDASSTDARGPDDVLETIRHLGFLQVDLTTVVAQHADLALWTRLGATYAPEHLQALMGDGAVVELRSKLRPSEDIALFQADMETWPGRPPLTPSQERVRDWVAANEGCHREDSRRPACRRANASP